MPAFNDSAVTRSGVVEFYLDPVIHSSTNHQLLVGTYAVYTVEPVVFLTDDDLTISDNFPADGNLFADQANVWNLNYSVANTAATYQGQMISSGPAVMKPLPELQMTAGLR